MANGITNGILESAVLDPTSLYDGKMLVDNFTETNFGVERRTQTRVLELDGEVYAPIWNKSSNSYTLNWCKYNQTTNQWNVVSEIQTTRASSSSGTACTSVTYFKNRFYVIFAKIDSGQYVNIKSSEDGLTWADELTNFTTDESTNPFCDIISNNNILTAVIASRERIRFWTTTGIKGTLFNWGKITTTGSSSNSNWPYLFYGDDGVCYVYIVNTSAIYKVENITASASYAEYDNLQIDAFAKVVSWNNRLYISSTSGLIIYKASDKSKETINIEGQWIGIGSDNTGVWGLSEDTVYKIDASQNVKKYKTDYALKQMVQQRINQKIIPGVLLFVKNNLLAGLLTDWGWGSVTSYLFTVSFLETSVESIRDWSLKNNTWEIGLPALYEGTGNYIGTGTDPLKIIFPSDISIDRIEMINASNGGATMYRYNYPFSREVLQSGISDCVWGNGMATITKGPNTAGYLYVLKIYGTYIGNGLNQ